MKPASRGSQAIQGDELATACLDDVRYLVSLLPSNNHDLPPFRETDDPPDRRCPRLADIVPANPKIPYDIREVITEIADHGEFMEVREHWARSLVCTLTRLGGRTVGIMDSRSIGADLSFAWPTNEIAVMGAEAAVGVIYR